MTVSKLWWIGLGVAFTAAMVVQTASVASWALAMAIVIGLLLLPEAVHP